MECKGLHESGYNRILRFYKTSIECIDVCDRFDLVYVNHCNILFAARKVIMMVIEESADVICIIHNYQPELGCWTAVGLVRE